MICRKMVNEVFQHKVLSVYTVVWGLQREANLFILIYLILINLSLIVILGMDMRLWKQAQADNPDPENYIPVPIIGFSEVSV